MLKREAASAGFTAALISLGYFVMDVIRDIINGNLEAALSGFDASIIGIVVSFFVLLSAGWWLYRDGKATQRREDEMRDSLINTINQNTNKKCDEIIRRLDR